jgi:copper resistance protein D
MDAIDLAQAILRGAHLISLVSLFGALVFLAVVAPAALAEAGAAGEPARRRLVRLARCSTALALAAGLAWLVIQAALIAGANSAVGTLHALPIVALHTRFGCSVLVRFSLLMAVLPLAGVRRLGLAVAIALTGMALGLQAAIGHAGAIGGNVGAALLSSELMHLLAAGAWLGGLLPLLICLALYRSRPR